MESSGVAGKINISQSTFELIKNYFECEYRGKLPAKNKGELDMYLVKGIKQHFLASTLGSLPNTAEFNYLTSAIKCAEYCYAS
jgi:hypothetical protein